MLLQYLHEEGYNSSRLTLHDEANVKWKDLEEQQVDVKRMRKAILGTEDVQCKCERLRRADVRFNDLSCS
jgi:hypothetical protein